MKNAKKLLALMLAVVMTLALAIPAFAASSEEDHTGSITITNTDKFEDPEYTAYKIFDVTYADGEDEDGAFSYTISSTSPWLATVQTYFDTEAAEADATVLVVTPKTGYDAATFAAALKTAYDAMVEEDEVPTDGVTLAGAGAEELALGYWFVTTTTGSLCNLTTTHPDAEIHDKNEPTPFDKEAGSEEIVITGSVQLGDVVPYTITGKVPSTVGYSEYTYKVGDTITGAIFQKDVIVKFGDEIITPSETELVYNREGTGFTLTFDMTKYQEYVDKSITITYSALVDDSSLTAGDVVNTATLEHTHTPTDVDDLQKEPDVVVVVKTFSIDLSKVADDGTSPLAGAEFVLTNAAGKYYKYTPGYDGIDENGKPTGPVPGDVEWVSSIDDATVVVTGTDGKAIGYSFVGLAEGTYNLIETKSPAGFNLPKDPFVVTIEKDGDPYVVSKEDTDDDGEIDLITKETAYKATVKGPYDTKAVDADIDEISYVATTIMNKSGVLLPETGGIGTVLFIAIGAVLFIAAGIVLTAKKRLYNEG